MLLKNDGTVETSVYNKTDDFNFAVVRYVHAESNTSKSVGLNTFFGQLVRLARLSSTRQSFVEKSTELYRNCRSKGYGNSDLQKRLMDFWKYWRPLLSKFGLHGKSEFVNFRQLIVQE